MGRQGVKVAKEPFRLEPMHDEGEGRATIQGSLLGFGILWIFYFFEHFRILWMGVHVLWIDPIH